MRTQPLLGVEGSARLPSVLEIWLGQQQVMRSDLPPGPFVVEGIPGRTGRGELQAVITMHSAGACFGGVVLFEPQLCAAA